MDWFNVNYDTVQIFDYVNTVMNLWVLKYRGMHRLASYKLYKNNTESIS
jgi:hypothetical protein